MPLSKALAMSLQTAQRGGIFPPRGAVFVCTTRVKQTGNPLCPTGGKMPDNKVTDNRCRRYIRITDEESWRIDYINSYRISVACDQMQTYNFDVAAAAQWVGYTDIKYFFAGV